MKSRFWSSDWFAGLLITIAIVFLSGTAPFQSLERGFYDWGVRSTDRQASDKVVGTHLVLVPGHTNVRGQRMLTLGVVNFVVVTYQIEM